jgi:hypothetical protein
MFIAPFEIVTFATKLSESEIFIKLSNYVEPRQWFEEFFIGIFQPRTKPYAGKVDAQGFAIKRNVRYHSPSLPHIEGKFERQGTGTKIVVTMRFQYSASIGLATFFLFFLYSAISYNDFTFLPIVAAFYFVSFIWFRLEVSRSKEDLEKYLEEDSSLG